MKFIAGIHLFTYSLIQTINLSGPSGLTSNSKKFPHYIRRMNNNDTPLKTI